MEVHNVQRAAGHFQEPIPRETLLTLYFAHFSTNDPPLRAVEISSGMYNTTYRITQADHTTIILKIAPIEAKQYLSEQHFLRNEHAAVPYFAAIAHLLPDILGIDFTHRHIPRDYIFYSYLTGRPASEAKNQLTSHNRLQYYYNIGELVRRIAIPGTHFGRFVGAHSPTWSQALIEHTTLMLHDFQRCQLTPRPVQALQEIIHTHHHIFDAITTPRLVHGDLWTTNIFLHPEPNNPTIRGIIDWDRASWADPLSDWSIFMASRRPAEETAAFWQGLGQTTQNPATIFRITIYTIKNTLSAALESARLKNQQRAQQLLHEAGQLLHGLTPLRV